MVDCINCGMTEMACTCAAEIAEGKRIKRAIGHYAMHAPLDLKSRREIQSDLFAICGEPHYHIASIGSDECDLCGRDLRHDVHKREHPTDD